MKPKTMKGKETIIPYRGYVIRIIPSTQTIIAIPSTAHSIYYPIGDKESKKEALEQTKIMIDELLEKLSKQI